jgi:di/tricarboxylate transporter
MTAFGTAMNESGAAAFLADNIVKWLSPGGDLLILAGFLVLTVLLTQPMSNAAAALVVLPIAMEAAELLGADQRSFAVAIMLAASVSFIAPFEPACILVYGPGKYRFFDFVKVGASLTAVLLVIVLLLVPALWPLR